MLQRPLAIGNVPLLVLGVTFGLANRANAEEEASSLYSRLGGVYNIGLVVPRQSSTGGRERMGRISKQGDHYLRWLLVAGAMSVIRHGRKTNFEKTPWLADLVHRKPMKVAAVALANKIARTAWALLANGEPYQQPAAAKA